MSDKPDCYKCQWGGNVAGSHHSSCKFISMNAPGDPAASMMEMMIAAGLQELKIDNEPATVFNPHGIKKGWAIWPMNFDPCWLESCKLFKQISDV